VLAFKNMSMRRDAKLKKSEAAEPGPAGSSCPVDAAPRVADWMPVLIDTPAIRNPGNLLKLNLGVLL
jgi:hypothetical protein